MSDTTEQHRGIKSLKEEQQQLDRDGRMVGVSRQALIETFAEIERLRDQTTRLRGTIYRLRATLRAIEVALATFTVVSD